MPLAFTAASGMASGGDVGELLETHNEVPAATISGQSPTPKSV
jgi:hypothetical protein